MENDSEDHETELKARPDTFPEVIDKKRTVPVILISVVDDLVIFVITAYVIYYVYNYFF